MIELLNIEKEYTSTYTSVQALSNINLVFESGKFYGIMGPSGSGKSTLIQIIGLLSKPSSGSIKINGIEMTTLSEKEMSQFRKDELGFIFQSFHLIQTMNVEENILLPLLINNSLSKKEKIKKVDLLLKMLGVDHRKKHYPNQLSNGEQQRVAIARAICNSPNIILADEPTGALDEKNTKKIFEILKKFSKEGKCVIVVCHDNIIRDYADEIICLNDGMAKLEAVDE